MKYKESYFSYFSSLGNSALAMVSTFNSLSFIIG